MSTDIDDFARSRISLIMEDIFQLVEDLTPDFEERLEESSARGEVILWSEPVKELLTQIENHLIALASQLQTETQERR